MYHNENILTHGCIVFFSGEGYYANQDDELIFEDFARLRLKGLEGDDTEA